MAKRSTCAFSSKSLHTDYHQRGMNCLVQLCLRGGFGVEPLRSLACEVAAGDLGADC